LAGRGTTWAGLAVVTAAVVVALVQGLTIQEVGIPGVATIKFGVKGDAPQVLLGRTAQGDNMSAGEVLHPGDSLNSSNGSFSLKCQEDGNLVLSSRTKVLWASNTDGERIGGCVVQGDGNLVIRGPSGEYVWDAGSSGKGGAKLTVQDDGNVVIYTPEGHPVWDTGTVQ
jgi:hypothetical protein